MSQKIREITFWAFDRIKGSGVGHHYANISHVLKSDDKTISSHTENRKRSLIKHVVNSTEFYKQYDESTPLKEFPVIDKSRIREQYHAFISNRFTEKERLPVVTSGSTGTPFKVFHDQDKKNRNTADTLYFARMGGYEIGHRLIYLKIWAKEKMASNFHYKLQNMVPVDVIKLDDQQITSLLSGLDEGKGPYSILGYVSALESVCKYLDRSGGRKSDRKASSVITMSEALTPYVKERMEYYFGAEVLSRYSNLENGIIAQQVPGSDGRFLINSASYIVEILAMNSDSPSPKGEPGRIVVTDLYNYAMPMLRYDTGDIGVISDESDQYGNLYLDNVEGRKLDLLYDTSGEIVSSYIMYKNMWKYVEIKQYQLIQEGPKKYTFKINIDNKFEKEKQLVSEFKTYLGDDADFRVEYVDEIPLLASGKRKKTVNNWK